MKRVPIRVEAISTYMELRRKAPIFAVNVAGGLVIVADLASFDPEPGDIKRFPFDQQAEIVLDPMKRYLEAAGSSPESIGSIQRLLYRRNPVQNIQQDQHALLSSGRPGTHFSLPSVLSRPAR